MPPPELGHHQRRGAAVDREVPVVKIGRNRRQRLMEQIARRRRCRQEAVRPAVGGVVHQQLNRPERNLGAVEERRDVLGIAQIRLPDIDVAALLSNLRHHGLGCHRLAQPVLRLPRLVLIRRVDVRRQRQSQVVDEHARALGGEGFRRRRADAVVRSRNERDLAAQSCIDHRVTPQ